MSAWYVSRGGERLGPLTDRDLRRPAVDGQLSPEDLVWRKGMAGWKPAASLRALFPASDSGDGPPPLPADRPDDGTPARPATGAWDPRLIGALGLLFTPVWAGVMAALNRRRLGLGLRAALAGLAVWARGRRGSPAEACVTAPDAGGRPGAYFTADPQWLRETVPRRDHSRHTPCPHPSMWTRCGRAAGAAALAPEGSLRLSGGAGRTPGPSGRSSRR